MERKRPRILVVEDELGMCWALESMLCSSGFTVTITVTGTEALELLSRKHYAVALVDAKLPDLDGLELAALIRQRSPHTVVVLMSGYFYKEDTAISEGLQEGLFADFISKPFDLEEVCLMVRQAMALGSSSTSQGASQEGR